VSDDQRDKPLHGSRGKAPLVVYKLHIFMSLHIYDMAVLLFIIWKDMLDLPVKKLFYS